MEKVIVIHVSTGNQMIVAKLVKKGLALHREVCLDGIQGKYWTVTHTASGLGLVNNIKSMKRARLILEDCLGVDIWEKPQEEVIKDEQAEDKYRFWREYKNVKDLLEKKSSK